MQVLDRAPASLTRLTTASQSARGRPTVARRPLKGSEAHHGPGTTAKKCVNPCARFSTGFPTNFPSTGRLLRSVTLTLAEWLDRHTDRWPPARASLSSGPRPARVPSVRGECEAVGLILSSAVAVFRIPIPAASVVLRSQGGVAGAAAGGYFGAPASALACRRLTYPTPPVPTRRWRCRWRPARQADQGHPTLPTERRLAAG